MIADTAYHRSFRCPLPKTQLQADARLAHACITITRHDATFPPSLCCQVLGFFPRQLRHYYSSEWTIPKLVGMALPRAASGPMDHYHTVDLSLPRSSPHLESLGPGFSLASPFGKMNDGHMTRRHACELVLHHAGGWLPLHLLKEATPNTT